MTTDEIREAYQAFFEERGHLRVPSASLIPAPEDTSTLLTVAGMQPFKPYFRGEAKPPSPRVVNSQKCFRTPDIAQVGNTLRHLTFFEMLGNWSFGDYFKEESIAWGIELSVDVFGLDKAKIWVSVFGGDEELGLGPDTEAIEIWKANGIPAERIVELPRSENFWQGGLTGPCGPCAEMYLDRGEEFDGPDVRPGDDTDRYLEYWNHVFMTYDLLQDGSLEPLPKNNIDTGMGLERMAAVLQGVESVYDTDSHRPLIDLAEELSGKRYDEDAATTRAMRIVADHAKGASFLIADGVVPSNEERGYVLRRVLRRAIQQGRTLGLEAPWLGAFAERTIEMMSGAYPQLVQARGTIERWIAAEEESFGQHPRAGIRAPREADRRGEGERDLVDRRRGGVQAPRHLRLPVRHDARAPRRAGPLRGRLRLRGADGRAARAGAGRWRDRRGRRARGRARVHPRGAAHELRRLRDARGANQRRRLRGRRWGDPREARGEPLLRGGRRSGRRRRGAAVGWRRGGRGGRLPRR